ncbi:MAG: hypothetical protein AAF416_11670 [Pseudomonadota bacterium]
MVRHERTIGPSAMPNGATGAEIARLIEVIEGAVGYHVRRMQAEAVDGWSA